jgi:hypothetical protein
MQVKMIHDLFMLSGLVSEFNLSVRNLRGFITTVSRSYHQAVPYHNFNHVCHVTHTAWLVSGHDCHVTHCWCLHICVYLLVLLHLAVQNQRISLSKLCDYFALHQPAVQMLQTPTVSRLLTSEDKLALLVSALCHDLDHDGYSNTFHGEELHVSCPKRQ